jgi:hypothetical protein
MADIIKFLTGNIPPDILESLRKQVYGLLGQHVGKYKRNEELSSEEQYKQLEAHHIEETEFLIALLMKWGNTARGAVEMLTEEQKRFEKLEKELEDKTRL